jgi:predicted aspartyl protease
VLAYFDDFGYPRVNIEVRGSRAAARVAAMLDTGFDGELSLPIDVATNGVVLYEARREGDKYGNSPL